MGRVVAAACWSLAIATFTAACGRADSVPTAASGTPAASSSTPCAYTISGVISTDRADPLAEAMVQAAPYPYGYPTHAKTDSQGTYSLCGPSGQLLGVHVYRTGYATAFKYALPAREQRLNLALRPRFEVPVGGGTASGGITGDEFEAGDDYFGGLCSRVPCKVVDFTYVGCPCPNRAAEITLQRADPMIHLALYFSLIDDYFPPRSVPPGARYCCTSPVSASYTFNADFDRFGRRRPSRSRLADCIRRWLL